MLDLIILAADGDIEITLRTLLEKRHAALGIRPLRFDKQQADCIRSPLHDAGVLTNGPQILRPYLKQAQHALVVLDRFGSGRELDPPDRIEHDIEDRLIQAGWKAEQVAAIVLDPELELWVWSGSPHVLDVLNIDEQQMMQVYDRFAPGPDGKPSPPKEAMLYALRLGGRPHSARIFKELAERVSLKTRERAFSRLRDRLQHWFPLT
ncbi:MAG: hypothetical protein NZM00_00365 [Anaerolinea sp.]|nr:hypothetical protein [Anaerolinea sp.]